MEYRRWNMAKIRKLGIRKSEARISNAPTKPELRTPDSKLPAAGFTLIELMLAMAFLSFMLIFIVLALIQYMATYNKGVVYKEINQAGRTIFEDVTRSLRVSSANVRSMDEGRLCVGGQAYVWNTAATDNRYADTTAVISGIIRVPDSTGSLCSSDLTELIDVPQEGETVIAGSDIAVQTFTGREADDGGLYYLNLKLSTSGSNAPINFEGDIQCPPGRDGQYCALAEFETHVAARR